MLKEKKKSLVGEVVAIKLVSGDEIIARLVDEDKPAIHTVARPLAMVMAENPDNPTQTRVMFTPWMVAATDGNIEIRSAHIMAIVAARQDAAEQYEQAIA